ncbi:hypothetical protein K505DRAFT_397331 [Melanomma pulvis-pyrius CBS 109.77]|uniref:Mid2 domain-containing protein n=1 Tax=Melanomma pulvis-pyrius CBS 109.77 TaxID=1314802 RepID=A0A6A6XN09_9PLEO|nr:hypothetical protein K505DRAFT_397331 [Melanomma pulvis-pyrius CBS 109.77]
MAITAIHHHSVFTTNPRVDTIAAIMALLMRRAGMRTGTATVQTAVLRQLNTNVVLMTVNVIVVFQRAPNICVSQEDNPIAYVRGDKLNAIYSSLSSQNPAFTSWAVDLATVTATGTAIRPSSASTTPITSTTPTGTSTPSPSPKSRRISGGALAGIIVGAVVALALVAAGILILFRRKATKKGKQNDLDDVKNEDSHDKYLVVDPTQQLESARAPAEMPNTEVRLAEVEGSTPLNEMK